MEPIPMYRLLSKENKILGLEFMDLLTEIIFFLVIFLVSRNLIINSVLLGASYLVLRRYKKNKPPHYTKNLIRILTLPQKYTEGRETSL